jgi:hypothetical protein
MAALAADACPPFQISALDSVPQGWFSGVGGAVGMDVRIEMHCLPAEVGADAAPLRVTIWSSHPRQFVPRDITGVRYSLRGEDNELVFSPELMEGLAGTVVTDVKGKWDRETNTIPLQVVVKITGEGSGMFVKAVDKVVPIITVDVLERAVRAPTCGMMTLDERKCVSVADRRGIRQICVKKMEDVCIPLEGGTRVAWNFSVVKSDLTCSVTALAPGEKDEAGNMRGSAIFEARTLKIADGWHEGVYEVPEESETQYFRLRLDNSGAYIKNAEVKFRLLVVDDRAEGGEAGEEAGEAAGEGGEGGEGGEAKE